MSDPRPGPLRRLGAPILGIVVLVGAAFLVWQVMNDTTAVKRKAAPMQMIDVLPPPPPPPPPPPEPLEKPPEPQEEQVVAEAPQEEAPKSDAPKDLTMAADAQAGDDSFGIKAGSGGGMKVGGDPNGSDKPGGLGTGLYNSYLKTALQRALQGDKRVNRKVFKADVAVWIDAAGRITRAQVRRTTGDRQVDENVVAALEGVSLDQPPPQSIKFPQLVAVTGRRGL